MDILLLYKEDTLILVLLINTKLLITDYRLPNQHKPLTINSYFFELENTLKYTYSSIYNYIYRTILVK